MSRLKFHGTTKVYRKLKHLVFKACLKLLLIKPRLTSLFWNYRKTIYKVLVAEYLKAPWKLCLHLFFTPQQLQGELKFFTPQWKRENTTHTQDSGTVG